MDITKIFETEQRNISLFSGCRGIERGFDINGVKSRTITYVEKEAFVVSNLVAEMEKTELDAAPIWTDIKTFNAKPFHRRIHSITGGYPCQPFSYMGARNGILDERFLWFHIERVINDSRPFWGFFENVSGHLTDGFDIVSNSLQKLGYLVEPGLFNSVETAGKHIRKRLFILFVANSCCRQQGREAEFLLFKKKIKKHQNELKVHIRSTGSSLHVSLPGNKQQQWENGYTTSPDEIKSALDLPADGHAYIEDLLSLAGNAVVPQTAGFAFLTLLDRIITNYNK